MIELEEIIEQKGMLQLMTMLTNDEETTIGKSEKLWLQKHFDDVLLIIQELESTQNKLSELEAKFDKG